MQTFKKYFLFTLALLALGSCRSVRQETQKSENETVKVVEKKTTYKDTVFYTKEAKTELKIPASFLRDDKCLNDAQTPIKKGLKSVSPKIFTSKNGNATVRLKIERDTIFAFVKCDSIALDAKIRERYESNYQLKNSLREREEKENKKTNLFGWIGGLIIAFIAGFVTKSLIKITI